MEIKRLEQVEKRHGADRDHLMRTIMGLDSGLVELNQENTEVILGVDKVRNSWPRCTARPDIDRARSANGSTKKCQQALLSPSPRNKKRMQYLVSHETTAGMLICRFCSLHLSSPSACGAAKYITSRRQAPAACTCVCPVDQTAIAQANGRHQDIRTHGRIGGRHSETGDAYQTQSGSIRWLIGRGRRARGYQAPS
jgi:hypothetical protein